MKFFRTIFMLSLVIIFIVIYVNNAVLTKKINHKSNEKANSAITLHKDEHSIKEKHLRAKRGVQSKMKLSAKLAKAKEICWSGQHISTRVINGTNAAKDTLPWIVAIFVLVKKDWTFHCGGSIISTKFVLSAAHCFLTRDDSSPKPTDYLVRYGAHNLSSTNYVKGTIVEIHNHPKFEMGYNDIALIRLKHEVKYNDIISPICIPGLTTPSFRDNWTMGDPVLISSKLSY